MKRLATLTVSIWGLIGIAAALLYTSSAVNAQNSRSGKQIVEEVCAACHQTGENDAPRIGDNEAWSARSSAGLTALTQHALNGIRQMPAHGGQPGLSDLEIARAIAYMVNASGGDWVEPTSDSQLMTERTGKEVVESTCASCHQEGKDGAPRVGDMQAWALRLRQGLPHAVQSAIRGHGGMPPRGGAADLSDSEIRNAILYMLNPEATTAARSAKRPVKKEGAPAGVNHLTVGGLDIYIGFMTAEKVKDYPAGSVERLMHGGVPRGNDWYHINVSLLDAERHVPVTNAKVDAEVEDLGVTTESKPLETMAIGAGSYGNYFRMTSPRTYRITVRVDAPGSPETVEAEFRYKRD